MNQDLVIGGGEAAQAIVESSHDTLIAGQHENWLVNGANLGIYAHGRIHQQVGREIFVSDLIHKRGPRATDDILLMEEQCLLSCGEPLTVRSSYGKLLALATLPAMQTANGEGDLIAYYEGGVVAFDTHQAPRESRSDGDGNLITKGWDQRRLVNYILNVVSAVGRYAVALLPRDHFFRSEFGLHFLRTVIGEGSFATEQINTLSTDIDPLLQQDPANLLSGAATGHWVFGNRMFCSTGLKFDASLSAAPYGRGLVTFNQAISFTDNRSPLPGWEGLWTFDSDIAGLHWLGNVGIRFTSESYGFLCSNHEGEIYFGAFDSRLGFDYRDETILPIEWSLETGQFAFEGLSVTKALKGGRFEAIFAKHSARVRVLVRTDRNPIWREWAQFSPCDKPALQTQRLMVSETLGEPPRECRVAAWFQIRVEGLGEAEIRSFDLDYSIDAGRSGRYECAVVGTSTKDPFESNSSPVVDRWPSP